MRASILVRLVVSATVTTSALGCAMAPTRQKELAAATFEDLASCPSPSATDDQLRASATVALRLMQGAATVSQQKGGTASAAMSAISILAAPRYRFVGANEYIEFDPNDPLYGYVSDTMKAELAFAQQDASVGTFLRDGLAYAYRNTDGKVFPEIDGIQALATYTYPTGARFHVADPDTTTNSHYATASGSLWCGTSIVTIFETVDHSSEFSSLFGEPTSKWQSHVPSAFKGTGHTPWTPFNGPSAAGNPYMIVTVNGVSTNWAKYNFTPLDCSNSSCSMSLQIDPVPYAEPGDYYSSQGMLGTQVNPFQLSNTVLYADPSHASQWATRTANGVQEWGTFSSPTVLFGTTKYKYVKHS